MKVPSGSDPIPLRKQPVFANPYGDPRLTVFNAMSQNINRSSKEQRMRHLADTIPKLKLNSKQRHAADVELACLVAHQVQDRF